MRAPADGRHLDYVEAEDDERSRREEMLPYLVAVLLGALACGSVVFAWTAVT